MHWTNCFTGLLDDETKLVGLTLNHTGVRGTPPMGEATHVQGMMWATDKVGVDLLEKTGILTESNDETFKNTIINKEIGMSRKFIDNSYKIKSFA